MTLIDQLPDNLPSTPEKIENASYLKKILDKVSDEDLKFASKLRLARSAVIYKPAADYDETLIAEEVLEKARNFVNKIITLL